MQGNLGEHVTVIQWVTYHDPSKLVGLFALVQRFACAFTTALVRAEAWRRTIGGVALADKRLLAVFTDSASVTGSHAAV